MAKIYTPPDIKTNLLFFPKLNKKVIVKNKTEIAQGLILSINAENHNDWQKPMRTSS